MTNSLPRTTLYEHFASTTELANLHIHKLDAAGFHLSETRHPACSRIPLHSHETSSVYLVLEGSLTEHYGRHSVDRQAGQLVFTPQTSRMQILSTVKATLLFLRIQALCCVLGERPRFVAGGSEFVCNREMLLDAIGFLLGRLNRQSGT